MISDLLGHTVLSVYRSPPVDHLPWSCRWHLCIPQWKETTVYPILEKTLNVKFRANPKKKEALVTSGCSPRTIVTSSFQWSEITGAHRHQLESAWMTCGGHCDCISHLVASDSATRELQPARLLCPWDFPGKWVAMPCSRVSPDPGIEPVSPALQALSLLTEPLTF